MLLTWNGLRRALNQEIETPEAQKAFLAAGRGNPLLGRFPGPEEFVAWLLDHKNHSVADEDEALRVLRKLSLTRKPESTLWQSILLLGIWPAVEWVFRKVRECEQDGDGAAISALWGGIVGALDKDDLWTEPGIAKRLMYFLWRRARADLRDVEFEHGKLARVHNHLMAGMMKWRQGDEPSPELLESWPSFASRCEEEAAPTDSELASLHDQLTVKLQLPISDADLLIRHFVMGESLADIAKDCDISPAACRQRCSRIVKRLRTQPVRVRRGLVTLSNLNGMDSREDELPHDDEGDDACPEPWMN